MAEETLAGETTAGETSSGLQVPATAMVTGASRGIGRAIALALAERGFDVVATMRDPAAGAALVEEGSGRIRVERLDVDDPSTYRIPDDLQVLVNNAGADAPHVSVEHGDIDDWRHVFDTNVFGLVRLTAAAIPVLRANAPSVVCNLTSSSALTPVPFYAAYRASKAAASAVSDTLRVELAPFGVRVVEIMPGPVDTDMFRESDEPVAGGGHEPYGQMAEVYDRMRTGANDMVVPPIEAARAIVDAILATDGPLRVGCDPLAIGLIDHWRSNGDEAMYDMIARPLLAELDGA